MIKVSSKVKSLQVYILWMRILRYSKFRHWGVTWEYSREMCIVYFSTLQLQKEKGHLDIRKLLWKYYFGKNYCLEYLIPNRCFGKNYWLIPKGNKVEIKHGMLLWKSFAKTRVFCRIFQVFYSICGW